MDKLTYEQVIEMDLPNIIGYATPVMISLVLLEWGLSQYKNRDIYDARDTFAAAAIGVVKMDAIAPAAPQPMRSMVVL